MQSPITRRNALTTVAALAAVPAVPFAALASMPDPVAAEAGRPATQAEWAAMNFEPWTGDDPKAWKPPTTSAAWWEELQPVLRTIAIAHAMLFKTKAELMELADSLSEEAGQETMDLFLHTTKWLEAMTSIVSGAEARFLCAGATINEEAGMTDEASS